MTRIGLVVGKFCPLHHGHEALIAFARQRCDHLALISYTKPDHPAYPSALRARWLAELFPDATRLVADDALLAAHAARTGTEARRLPDNDAPDAEHRAFTAWLCLDVLRTTVDLVFTSEDYGDGLAEALTDIFRKRAGYEGRVTHISFDRARTRVPVSASMIRRGDVDARHFVSESVLQTW